MLSGVLREVEEDHLRYPIGTFKPKKMISEVDRANYSIEIANIVPTLQEVIKNLDNSQLQTPYRNNGWTVQQIIHHMADNDMNAFIRLKRALTEEQPQASSYREDLWAELNDYKETPVFVSFALLESIHFRLIKVLEGLKSHDFERRFSTKVLGLITVDTALQRFIWHNKHHTAQIQELVRRVKW